MSFNQYIFQFFNTCEKNVKVYIETINNMQDSICNIELPPNYNQ